MRANPDIEPARSTLALQLQLELARFALAQHRIPRCGQRLGGVDGEYLAIELPHHAVRQLGRRIVDPGVAALAIRGSDADPRSGKRSLAARPKRERDGRVRFVLELYAVLYVPCRHDTDEGRIPIRGTLRIGSLPNSVP